jgi:hypothetical protein
MKRLLPLVLAAVLGAALLSLLGSEATAKVEMRKTPPLIGGFFAGRPVTYLLTDVSTRKDAKALSKAIKFPVTFSAKLSTVPDRSLAKLYLFTNGVKGANPFGFQANVIDSVPGQGKYSPLWRVYAVRWNSGTGPRLLKSEQAILSAKAAGELTITKTPLIKNSPVLG